MRRNSFIGSALLVLLTSPAAQSQPMQKAADEPATNQSAATRPGAAPQAAKPQSAPKPAVPELYFIAPRNGATVHGPVTVQFGLKGAGIAPAGVKFDNTGHHHLLVDTDLSQINMNATLPMTDKILHFGKGQTETELKLEPGEHTLQLVLADYTHVPVHPALVSKQITIHVVP